MFIDNPEENLDKYTVVLADRPDIGKRIIATREEQDEQFPPRWMYEIVDDPKTVDYFTRSAFTAIKSEWKRPVTTSELIKIAQDGGYGKWYVQKPINP